MKYSLKNLNKSIDRWIANKIKVAPDKDYTETFLREQYADLVHGFEGLKKFIQAPHFQTAYHKYKIGDHNYLEKLFATDDELITEYHADSRFDKTSSLGVQICHTPVIKCDIIFIYLYC